MKNLVLLFSILLSVIFNRYLLGQDEPSLIGQGTGKNLSTTLVVIYDQMDNPGVNSITSQNFETANDIFDSFAADDFAFMDMTWTIESVDVLGVYYNGSGPASSVNVWLYSSDFTGGLPLQIVYSALNIIPSAGLADGSFSITLPAPVVLTEGWYWLCVQANMDYATGGQWGWTGRTVQSWSESAWKNPGGGFGTPCTPSWGYRVTNCAVGTDPDNCFRLNGAIIPVELNSFIAIGNNNEVELNWSTATETNNQGFDIERMLQDTQFKNIAYVPGFGTSTELHYYNYIDKGLTAGKYYYRLKQVDYNGSYEYSNVIEVDVRSLNEYALEQNYPNPFNPTTTIGYVLKEKSNAKLILLNAIGEEITVLVNEEQDNGFHKIDFNAANLPSGVYFYQISAGEFVSVKKMLLLK
jgi:hypothetical protein